VSTEKKSKLIGNQVTYQPNGQDLSTRPKNQPLTAKVISEERENDRSGYAGQKVVDLVVFTTANENGTMLKVRVPHKKQALPGQAYWE